MWVTTFVTSILMVLLLYLIAGLVFAMILMIRGLKNLDTGTQGSGWGFKVLIFPGIIAFWPWLWKKWRNPS